MLSFLYIYIKLETSWKTAPSPEKQYTRHKNEQSHYKLSYYHPLSICDRTLFAKWINKSNCLLFKLIQKMYFLSFEVNSLCDQKHFYLIPRHCWYRFFFPFLHLKTFNPSLPCASLIYLNAFLHLVPLEITQPAGSEPRLYVRSKSPGVGSLSSPTGFSEKIQLRWHSDCSPN